MSLSLHSPVNNEWPEGMYKLSLKFERVGILPKAGRRGKKSIAPRRRKDRKPRQARSNPQGSNGISKGKISFNALPVFTEQR